MPGILTGTTDVPTAGTRVQISDTERRVSSIVFRGRKGNTGNVYVGGSAVSSSAGFELAPGEAISFPFASDGFVVLISDLYVDAATDGDDVDWAADMWDL